MHIVCDTSASSISLQCSASTLGICTGYKLVQISLISKSSQIQLWSEMLQVYFVMACELKLGVRVFKSGLTFGLSFVLAAMLHLLT